MLFFTVATHPQHYYYAMLESAKKNDININVLGWRQKWNGFIWKFKLMEDALKKISPNELVMFIDAYDIIFLSDQTEIEYKFKKYNKRILFGATNNCESRLSLGCIFTKIFSNGKSLPKQPTKFDGINTGCYIGYANDLQNMFRQCRELYDLNVIKDDQKLI